MYFIISKLHTLYTLLLLLLYILKKRIKHNIYKIKQNKILNHIGVKK